MVLHRMRGLTRATFRFHGLTFVTTLDVPFLRRSSTQAHASANRFRSF